MNVSKNWVVPAALACVVMIVPSVTQARVHVSIGFGIHGTCWPYHGWCEPWYDPWHYHAYDYCPILIGPPVVIERHVVVREPAPPRPRPRPPAPSLSKDQQQRSELLKRLRIGDVSHRIDATVRLAVFVDDPKTREALERALRSDRDAAVRKAAVEALARQSGKNAMAALKEAGAEDASQDVRDAAQKAAAEIGGH
jgi:hypothetical protein